MRAATIFTISWLILVPASLVSQEPAEKNYGTNIPDEATQALGTGTHSMDNLVNALMLYGIGIAAFGLVSLALVAWLLVNDKLPKERAANFFVSIIIATLAAFLMVAGYGQQQMAAVMGLFGAILGYTFGKESPKG